MAEPAAAPDANDNANGRGAHLVKYQFRKGQPNPGAGRPRDLLLAAVKEVLTAEEARVIIEAVVKRAKAGDLRAVELLWDRIAGKPVARTEEGQPGDFGLGGVKVLRGIKWEEVS